MLRKSVPKMMDIQIKVIPAFLLRGSLKAVMPFEIASTPVKAVVPLANACRIKKGVIAESVLIASISGGLTVRRNLPTVRAGLDSITNDEYRGFLHEGVRSNDEQRIRTRKFFGRGFARPRAKASGNQNRLDAKRLQ